MERADSQGYVANDVDWHAVEHTENTEKGQIEDQLEEVCLKCQPADRGKIYRLTKNAPVARSR